MEAGVREQSEDVVLLALKMEERTMSQGMQAAPGSWRGPGDGFCQSLQNTLISAK